MSSAKKSRGRQKIEMKKMSNESNLQVTFSKRRGGLFKKASELCTLCGADVALVVFSPGHKVFSFGHPTVENIIDRYLSRDSPHDLPTMHIIQAHRIANVRDLNAQLTQINNHLDAERKRADELNLVNNEARAQLWWAQPMDEFSTAQLDHYKAALVELRKYVASLVAERGSNFVHQPHPTQVFPPQLIQPPMFHSHMFPVETMNIMYHSGFNNIGMGGYVHEPSTAFFFNP